MPTHTKTWDRAIKFHLEDAQDGHHYQSQQLQGSVDHQVLFFDLLLQIHGTLRNQRNHYIFIKQIKNYTCPATKFQTCWSATLFTAKTVSFCKQECILILNAWVLTSIPRLNKTKQNPSQGCYSRLHRSFGQSDELLSFALCKLLKKTLSKYLFL